MRSICVAALLVGLRDARACAGAAPTRGRSPPTPRSISSFLDPKPGWNLRAPSTGAGEPKQGARTIRILPDFFRRRPRRRRHYFVQLTVQRSAQEAQDRVEEIQERFPDALGSYRPVIRRTEAGLSILYRAMVGPFDLAGANGMCDGLKAKGGQCVVHRLDPEEVSMRSVCGAGLLAVSQDDPAGDDLKAAGGQCIVQRDD